MASGRVRASAPTRIDLAGGTLDIWPISVIVPDAVTVNLAVELRARAWVEPAGRGRLVIISRDRKRRVERRLPLPGGHGGSLSMLVRLVGAFEPRRGLKLVTGAEAPAGAGLGGSSALGMAVGAALNRFTRSGLGRKALLSRVMNVETSELRVPTGNQDYLAALHGGLAAYTHGADGTVRERLAIPAGLADRLVVAYAGEPRHSGYSNWEMFRGFMGGERTAVRRMESIARIAKRLVDALRDGDLDRAGRLVGEEGRLRYSLAPSVATRRILKIDAAARRAGALGVKVCGAGGGGCMVAFAAAGRRSAVADAMTRAGADLLEVSIARSGLKVSAP